MISSRLRASTGMRSLVREHQLNIDDLICPIFVVDEKYPHTEIEGMPGVYHWTLDRLERELDDLLSLGIRSVILFGLPGSKDERGSEADLENGIVQRAVQQIKAYAPDLYVIADLCLCQYTSHGHCGILDQKLQIIDREASVARIGEVAVSYAQAGVDMVAPSGMLDGGVRAIREALDSAGFGRVPILAYAIKYASHFYGPFRGAVASAPQFGDRKSYQLDPANAREALREAELDIAEGADMLIIKPALSYLDIICRAREQFLIPLVAYNVSGEYSMVKAAALQGWIDEREVVLEMLLSFKRAGADIIITYHAKDVAKWLKK